MSRRVRPLWDRFWERVAVCDPAECWEWRGGKSEGGYGKISSNWPDMRTLLVHRVVYEWALGSIPDGLSVDHVCRNRACVNPLHLEVVSLGENALRGDGPAAENSRKVYCNRGHSFDDANTYLWKGHRHCRACRAQRQRRYSARGRANS